MCALIRTSRRLIEKIKHIAKTVFGPSVDITLNKAIAELMTFIVLFAVAVSL
jgi:hypothetical protein